jgi:hypothetical protein
MTEYREILGALAVAIGLAGYVPYFRDIFRGKTKPHAFSWLVWSVLTGIAFAAQVTENAGAGSWITGITALACFAIFLLALVRGQRSFPVFDWISLIIAFVSMLLWWVTKEPTVSVILVSLIDAIGFLPTFRKGFQKPFEETAITFALSAIKFIPALIALETYTISTWLYPASLVLMNGLFVIMLLIRRNHMR